MNMLEISPQSQKEFSLQMNLTTLESVETFLLIIMNANAIYKVMQSQIICSFIK